MGKLVIGISVVSLLSCFIIMGITTLDVIFRKAASFSILGSNEITEVLMVIVMAFGFPALHVANGHVKVDMFVDKIPGRGRYFFISFILLVESIICGLMVWGTYEKSLSFFEKGSTTAILRIPQRTFALFLCAGLALFTVLLLIDTVIAFIDGFQYRKA